jgi:prepilin-type N-terminal cleavage/methylation domain-containing protein/prepilin-type processing-associated H-X9-DG protein
MTKFFAGLSFFLTNNFSCGIIGFVSKRNTILGKVMFDAHRKRAFTLVELLVVIALISMLLAIIMPSLSKARESARGIVCQSLVRNYTFAHFSYFTEYNKLMPISVNDPVMRPWLTFDEFRSFAGLRPLTQEYKDRRSPPNIQEYKPSYPKKYICPSASFALRHSEDGLYPMDRSYGLNAHCYGVSGKPALNIKGSRIVCMIDSLDWWFNYWGCDTYVVSGEVWKGYETYGVPALRHSKRANVSYWDGRCETITLNQLKTQLRDWFYRDGSTPPQQ